MEAVNRVLNLLVESVLPRLARSLLFLLLFSPALAAVLVIWSKTDPSRNAAFGMLSLVVSRLDSGFQLGLGPFLIRAMLLGLALLRVALDWGLPKEAGWLSRLSLAFLTLAFASSLLCSHPYEALLTSLDTALLMTVVVMVYRLPDRQWVPRAICASGVCVAFFSLADFLAFPNPDSGQRLNGTFHQCNITATYMACCLPWMLFQGVLRSGPMVYRVCWSLGASLSLLTLLLTSTRAAWAVTLLVVALQIWFPTSAESGRWWALPRAILLAGLISLCSLLVSQNVTFLLPLAGLLLFGLLRRPDPLPSVLWLGLVVLLAGALWRSMPGSSAVASPVARTAAIVEGTDFSTAARLEFWRGCLLMARDHPWVGVGPRGFHRYYPSYQMDQRWFSKFAHSSPLTVLAELGLPGFGLLIALVTTACLLAWRGFCRRPGLEAEQIRDAFLCSGALGLCSMFDVQWQFPLLPITWAAWIGYSLSPCWPQPELHAVGDPEEPAEDVHPWTLRPQVVLGYCRFGLLGFLALANFLWACAHYNFEVSELALQHRRYKDALELDRIAASLNPFQATYFHHLGLSMLAARNHLGEKSTVRLEELVRVAERAVQLDRHRAVHYDLLGKALLASKQPSQAESAYHQALECDSINYPSFYSSLVDCLDWEKDKQRPREILETCVRRFPPESQDAMFGFRSSDIDRQMGSVYMSLAESYDPVHSPERSITYYEKWLKMHPEDINARFGRTVCLLNLNRGKEALQEAQEIYRLDQGEAVRDLLGQVYLVERLPLQTLPFQWTPPHMRR